MTMKFRKANNNDVAGIMEIISAAVDRMLSEGKCQWSKTYPQTEHVLADIERGYAYVLESDGRVVAYGAVVFTGEPAYNDLEGEWLTDGDYVVVHRMAVAIDSQRRGVGLEYLGNVCRLAASQGVWAFRIDTNFDNERMMGLLKKAGFEFTGLVHYPQGERRAYEKIVRIE